ncbi:MAG: RNA methyltransferase [Propionibacteriaceae bacterium]|nr:RNA methyltransferase [Micropruina sp.]HBX82883.1 RNA methyltransferase [Propionibacteriaceae bacterium]HBY23368.1 RNA methyltransferase [Propionibacteriaceae bacterium]
MPEMMQLDSPSQTLLLETRKLLRRKGRKTAGKFLAEGRQAVREALGVPGLVEVLFVRWSDAIEHADLIERAREDDVPVYAVSEQNLASMADTVTPQGIIAVVRMSSVSLDVVKNARLVVVCAQIRDPGNAGTVIRCADAFGADAVILTEDSVELTNPKTVRASVGTMFHLPVVTGVPLAEALAACRDAGMQVLAADGDSDTLLTDLQDDLAKPTAWVMGNEAWGLPGEHLALADRSVAVPIYGKAESLNLATAAAICLFSSAAAQHADL